MRFKFDPNCTYAGRLDRVSKRPIENQFAAAVLLRLEFLIFRIYEAQIMTRGQIACRDIMLWPGMAKDPGVLRMAKALGLHEHIQPHLARFQRPADVGSPFVSETLPLSIKDNLS